MPPTRQPPWPRASASAERSRSRRSQWSTKSSASAAPASEHRFEGIRLRRDGSIGGRPTGLLWSSGRLPIALDSSSFTRGPHRLVHVWRRPAREAEPWLRLSPLAAFSRSHCLGLGVKESPLSEVALGLFCVRPAPMAFGAPPPDPPRLLSGGHVLRSVRQLVASLAPALAAAPHRAGLPRTKGLALAAHFAFDRGTTRARPHAAPSGSPPASDRPQVKENLTCTVWGLPDAYTPGVAEALTTGCIAAITRS
jgi:hypothetical protein